jgi:hypothetical protein
MKWMKYADGLNRRRWLYRQRKERLTRAETKEQKAVWSLQSYFLCKIGAGGLGM